MATKTLEKGSKYNQFDVDGDGTVTDDEMNKAQAMIDAENKDKKEDQLRSMAWVAMGSMVIFTLALFVSAARCHNSGCTLVSMRQAVLKVKI